MSEKPAGEKTEDPTPKRLTDGKKQGQVIKSADIVTTFVTVFVLATLIFSLGKSGQKLQAFLIECLRFTGTPEYGTIAMAGTTAAALFFDMVVPIIFAVFAGVVFGNVLQFGFIFASKAINPQFSKLNPFEGLKKMFSMKNIMEFVKATIKIVLLSWILYHVIADSLDPLSKLPSAGFSAFMEVARQMFQSFLVWMIAGFIVLAFLDYFLQRHLTMKDLRMTKDEVKRESKEMEGDPHIKSARKQLARELIFSDTTAAVKKSTVLVTNPTHIATAIYFERGVTQLPILLAKGKGLVAQRMMELARKEGIPVVQNVSLAREIEGRVDVNGTIPDDLLGAIADILRWVQTLPGRMPRQGGQPMG